MKKEDVQKLGTGVYRFYWANDNLGSVGSISIDREGTLRFHCSNWSSVGTEPLLGYADDIERAELLSNQKGDKGELATAWEMIKDMRDQAERVNKANEGVKGWTPLQEDSYNRIMERVNEHQVANDPNQPPISFSVEETQPCNEYPLALIVKEEVELIRAATNLIIASRSELHDGPEGEAIDAACKYLTSKFKGEPDAESD